MSHETYIERTIWVSQCQKCGDRDVRVSDPPRERGCKCGEWVPYVEESYIGPELEGRMSADTDRLREIAAIELTEEKSGLPIKARFILSDEQYAQLLTARGVTVRASASAESGTQNAQLIGVD